MSYQYYTDITRIDLERYAKAIDTKNTARHRPRALRLPRKAVPQFSTRDQNRARNLRVAVFRGVGKLDQSFPNGRRQ